MVKLLMTWDIRQGKETNYLEFFTREFAPALVKMGVQPTGAWYTVVGNGPQHARRARRARIFAAAAYFRRAHPYGSWLSLLRQSASRLAAACSSRCGDGSAVAPRCRLAGNGGSHGRIECAGAGRPRPDRCRAAVAKKKFG